MPGINFWMIFQVFGIVSAWSAKALQDGKITLLEAAELAAALGTLLGIPTNVEIPTPGAPEIVAAAAADEQPPVNETPPLTPKEQLMKPQATDQGGET